MTSVVRSVVTCQVDADVSHPSPLFYHVPSFSLPLFFPFSVFISFIPLASFNFSLSLSFSLSVSFSLHFCFLFVSFLHVLSLSRCTESRRCNPTLITLFLPSLSLRNVSLQFNPRDPSRSCSFSGIFRFLIGIPPLLFSSFASVYFIFSSLCFHSRFSHFLALSGDANGVIGPFFLISLLLRITIVHLARSHHDER